MKLFDWLFKKPEQTTGLVVSPEQDDDPRNLRYEDIAPLGVSPIIPLSGDVEVGDWTLYQGATSSCTCHSTVYALNQIRDVKLSARYAWHKIKTDPAYPSSRLPWGAYMKDSIDLFCKEGIAEYEDCPNASTGSDTEFSRITVSPAMEASARRHLGGSYIWVTTSAKDNLSRFDDVVRYLFEQAQPVKVAVTWRGSFNNARSGGVVPAELASGSSAGHDMLAVAWKRINGHEYLGFRNSFGATWGDKGRVWLPKGFFEISAAMAYIAPTQIEIPKPSPIPVERNLHKERAVAQELEAMIKLKFPLNVAEDARKANAEAIAIKGREWLVLWMGVTYRGWTFIDAVNHLYARSRGKVNDKAYSLDFNTQKVKK